MYTKVNQGASGIGAQGLTYFILPFAKRPHLGHNRYSEAPRTVTRPGIGQHLRIVVLVDGGPGGTASAAEILTAALQENGRATVIGTRTYGKGSEQEYVNLPDGSALRITTRLWLTPKKHQINGVGITPDIIVDRAPAYGDNQLQRARQYLATGH